ncbi:TonB-dependent receptor [Fulvivirga sp. M361]|uniref:TonB-dependent receptor plug domain-containing protein n=1 Tax=Fulvivirga sp. M361 TaxID=2594266 RepID=UPI00117BDCCF|nr:TonB-dependent receptor [Fulvivirga sp. M361]TRX60657.1 TonB-dependent receptor [Fulvivirga sp. M361]
MRGNFLKFFSIVVLIFYKQLAYAQDTDLLSLSLEELMNIEVTTASKNAENIFDAPGVMTVITSKEIEQFGANNLIELFERVPGLIPMSSYFFPNNMLSIRGDLPNHNDSHVLILIDGRPIRMTRVGGINHGIYTSYPVANIQRIEIIKGPGSALYGSNAFAGVVNIISKKATDSTLEARVGGGSFNTKKGSVIAGKSFGDLGATVALNYLETDGWEATMTDELGSSNVTQAGEKNVGLTANFDYKGLSLKSFLSFTDADVLGPFPKFPQHSSRLDSRMLDLGYEYNFSENWNINANITHNGFNWDTVNDFPGSDPDNIPLSESTTNDYLFEVSSRRSFMNNRINVLLGGTGYSITGDQGDSYSVFWWNSYFQADARLHDKFKLILGGQLNKPENTDIDFVPRIGGILNVTEKLGVKALWGQAFRSGYITELFVDVPILQGNPDLEPEKVSSLDLQVFYKTNNFQASASYYANRQKDLIDRVPVAGQSFQTFINQSERNINGFEFESRFAANSGLLVLAAFNYMHNEDGMTGQEGVTFAPDYTIKTGISYPITNGLQVGVNYNYVDDFGKVSLVNPGVSTVNTEADGYNLVSFNVNLDFPKLFKSETMPDLKLQLYGTNILAEDIYIPETTRKQINTIPYKAGAGYHVTLIYQL